MISGIQIIGQVILTSQDGGFKNSKIKKSKKRLIMSSNMFNQLDKIGKEIECKICEATDTDALSIKLEKCGHFFHKECLMEYVKFMLDSLKSTIPCPDYTCSCEMSLRDI